MLPAYSCEHVNVATFTGVRRKKTAYVMGVYVFQSVHGPYVKVGHYGRKNAWSRVAHRGFTSCAKPDPNLRVETHADVALVAWFPDYTRAEECAVKRHFKHSRRRTSTSTSSRPTEWYDAAALPLILEYLGGLGGTECAADCDKAAALATRRRL